MEARQPVCNMVSLAKDLTLAGRQGRRHRPQSGMPTVLAGRLRVIRGIWTRTQRQHASRHGPVGGVSRTAKSSSTMRASSSLQVRFQASGSSTTKATSATLSYSMKAVMLIDSLALCWSILELQAHENSGGPSGSKALTGLCVSSSLTVRRRCQTPSEFSVAEPARQALSGADH